MILQKKRYVLEAILNYIEDLEDIYLATERTKNPGKIYSQEEVEKALGLED